MQILVVGFVLALALVACNGKPSGGTAPSLASIDRSCANNGDCQIAGILDCCDTSCGERFGDAVNTRAWSKAMEARARRCEGTECPNVMCQPLPACRDEGHAVCRAGRCEVELRPNAACAPGGSASADPSSPAAR
jgi:hypothetical protein